MVERFPVNVPSADLLARGVPRQHLRTSLGSFPEGMVVANWLSKGGIESLAAGNCWLFDTRNSAAADTLPVIARAFLCRKIDAAFMRVDKLARMVEERNYKLFDRTARHQMLLLGDFFETAKGPRACPFSRTQRRRIEDLLLDRKSKMLGTILQIHNPSHLTLNYWDWWQHSVFEHLKPQVLRIPLPM